MNNLINCLRYFDYGVITNVKILYEISSDFPDVSFCDLNPYATTEGLKYSEEKIEEYKSFLSSINLTNDSRVASDYQIMLNSRFLTQMSIISKDNDFQRNISFPLENMLVQCTFNLETCTSDDFVWFYDAYYGSCFKFDSKIVKNRKSYRPGAIMGLNVDLLIANSDNQGALTQSNGIHIFLSNVSYLIY